MKKPQINKKTICSSSYTCQQKRIWFCEISLTNDIKENLLDIYKIWTWVTAILHLHWIPHHTNNLSSIILLWNIDTGQSFLFSHLVTHYCLAQIKLETSVSLDWGENIQLTSKPTGDQETILPSTQVPTRNAKHSSCIQPMTDRQTWGFFSYKRKILIWTVHTTNTN